MSTVVKIGGRSYIEPGSYAFTRYNPTSVANIASFGNVLVIDTGLSKNGSYEFAGGSGVKGELNQGLKSLYEFTSYEDFLNFMGGGQVADIANKLFNPLSGTSGEGTPGTPKLFYARAATTVCATINLIINTGVSPIPNDAIILKCKNEGIVGNGVKVSDVLKVGYSAKIVAGVTTGFFKLVVYRGKFAGVDKDGEPYGTKTLADSTPEIIFESTEVETLQELFDLCKNDRTINSHFVISMTGDGDADLDAVTEVLATGGTTEFLDSDEMDVLLESITDLDITFHLCMDGGSDATKADTNGKIFTFIKGGDVKFTEFMAVSGGSGSDDLFGSTTGTSESIAKYYNSGQVIVVHGSPEVPRKDGIGNKTLPTIYLTASIIGLCAGGAPQTPLTFKKIGYQNFVYDLKKKEREAALQLGIMHTRNVGGNWCVNQGVTSLQENKQTIALDGQSLEFSIELIKAQLNKELILEGEIRFTGTTAAQSSPESIKNFTETKLASRVAKPGEDDLLISWKNVKVTANNGDYTINYDFVPNVPVNKTFFIGNILDFKF